MGREIEATSDVLMWNLRSAIQFQDEKDALKTLGSLATNQDYISATIHTPDGQLFAQFTNANQTPTLAPTANQRSDTFLIKDGNQTLGQLTLITQDRHFKNHVFRILIIACTVTLMGLALAFGLAQYFSRSLSNSISNLILYIRRITALNDFSNVATRTDSKFDVQEIFDLSHEFDLMINQVKLRDAEIRSQNENLEKLVMARTTALSNAQNDLIKAERLSALGEMAAGVAHEINNPLAIISGKCSVALARINKDQPSEFNDAFVRDFNKITEMVARISKIIKGLKTFSRDGSKDPFEKAAVDDLVDETLILANDKIKTHDVSVHIDELTHEIVECRATQIGQILFNLLSNSIDAIESRTQKWIRISAVKKTPDVVWISITDSGDGIPAELREKIMQPFFTTKPVGKGTGLGLSVSTAIIKDHGGRLWVDETCPNTRFVIELPIKQGAG